MIYFVLFFIGICNALSLPLTGSVLSIWLTEENFTKEMIGMYALLGLPFSVKIIWSPIIDQFSLPFFRYAPRKGWMIFALGGIALSLLFLSLLSPEKEPFLLAFAIFTLLLFSSCLYIVGISYELESLQEENYAMGSFAILTGYRIGLILAGSFLLFFASLLSWSAAIKILIIFVLAAICLVAWQEEPFKTKKILEKQKLFKKHSNIFIAFWHETVQKPCQSFLARQDWMNVLLLLFFFKIGDQMAKSMEGPFYLELGFTKTELATASKLWGMAATIIGAFIAGKWVKGKKAERPLVLSGLLHACSLFCYYLMTLSGKSLTLLYVTTAIEHLTGGAAMAIFICYLWRSCDPYFAAIQYALLWSIYLIKSDLLTFFGASLAAAVSWPTFFLTVTALSTFSALLSFLWAFPKKKIS